MGMHNQTADILRSAREVIDPRCRTTRLLIEGLISSYESEESGQNEVFEIDALIRQLVGIIGDLETRILKLEHEK